MADRLSRLRVHESANGGNADFEEMAKQMEPVKSKKGKPGDACLTFLYQVTPDGGVLKRPLSEATSPSPEVVPANATVSAHYSLYLEHQDEPFDSTVLRGEAETFR